jgi:hypothetical protein
MKRFLIPVKKVKRFFIAITEAESRAEAEMVAEDAYIVGDYKKLQYRESVWIAGEQII